MSCMFPRASSRENEKGAMWTRGGQRGVISGYLSQTDKGNSHLLARRGENLTKSPLPALNSCHKESVTYPPPPPPPGHKRMLELVKLDGQWEAGEMLCAWCSSWAQTPPGGTTPPLCSQAKTQSKTSSSARSPRTFLHCKAQFLWGKRCRVATQQE